MPELPDVELYLHCLRPRIGGKTIERAVIVSPFVLRTYDPPIDAIEERTVVELRRMGKRIVLVLDDDLFVVIHLMIAGRFRWREPDAKPARRSRVELAALVFDNGTLALVEAGTKKRASIHVVRGTAALAAHVRDGLKVLAIDRDAFAERLRSKSHTLKRALTDPRLFSGIGNAYSDEILHRARLSPITLTGKLTEDEVTRLHRAVIDTLEHWTARLQAEIGAGFPGRGAVTAFRPGMAVHGKYGEPCPDCGVTVQRIVYADRETNYCPQCQTGGRILADRSLSRLLRDDWPRRIEDLEEQS